MEEYLSKMFDSFLIGFLEGIEIGSYIGGISVCFFCVIVLLNIITKHQTNKNKS